MIKNIKSFLSSLGYVTRYNPKKTHLQFKVCPNCGNPRWNFELEAVDKFVFNCWACNYHGATARFLHKLGYKELVPGPNKETYYKYRNSEFTRDYHKYWPMCTTVDTPYGTFENNAFLKVINKEPFYFYDKKILKGLLLLGYFGYGYLAVDVENRYSRYSTPDLYIYQPKTKKSNVLVCVEGFFDIFPFFQHYSTLILSGTYLNKNFLECSKEVFNQYKKIYICLDRNAEKTFKSQLQSLHLVNKELYILRSNKHSPSESEYISVVEKI